MSNYKVVLADECWQKMASYVDLCPDEIAAFGYIVPNDDGYMYVDDLFLVPQEVSGAEVDFVTEGLPYAAKKAAEDGRVNDLRFCVHSHVNMAASFSSTDEDMIGKVGNGGLIPWFVSAIFNKKGDTACRLDVFDTGIPGLMKINNVKLDILPESLAFVRDDDLVEIEKFVKKQKPKAHARKLPLMMNSYFSVPAESSFTLPSTAKFDTTHEDYKAWWETEEELEQAMDLYDEAAQKGWHLAITSDTTVPDGELATFYDDKGQVMGSCISLGDFDAVESYENNVVVPS